MFDLFRRSSTTRWLDVGDAEELALLFVGRDDGGGDDGGWGAGDSDADADDDGEDEGYDDDDDGEWGGDDDWTGFDTFNPYDAWASLTPSPHDPATFNPVVGFYNPATMTNYNPNPFPAVTDTDPAYNPATAPPDTIAYPANPAHHGFDPTFGVAPPASTDWSTPGIDTTFTGVPSNPTSNPSDPANPSDPSNPTANPSNPSNPSDPANPAGDPANPIGDGSGDTRPFVSSWADVFDPRAAGSFRGDLFREPGFGPTPSPANFQSDLQRGAYVSADPLATWWGPQGGRNPLGNMLQAGYAGRAGVPSDLAQYYTDVGYSPREAYEGLAARGFVPEPVYQIGNVGGSGPMVDSGGHGWDMADRPVMSLPIPYVQEQMMGALASGPWTDLNTGMRGA